MFCPECKSEKVEHRGSPVASAGFVWFPKVCLVCGYFWSDRTPPAPAVPPAVPQPPAAPDPEAVEKDDFPPVELPPQAPDPAPRTRTVEPCNPDELQVGDTIAFTRGQQTLEGPVAKVTAKTVVVDVDDLPDKSVLKSKILGRVIWR